MEHLRLARAPLTEAPDLPVVGPLAFRLGRVHEICGPARRSLALRVMARLSGPVIWIRPGWQAERLNPEGVCRLTEPGRLIFVDARRADDLLWCLEETLRSGAVALAVAELPEPPGLTPVRRLHLACEAGAQASGGPPPLGLVLTPGPGGAAGVESRWSFAPDHAPGDTGWQLRRLRARAAPPAAWRMAAGGALSAVQDTALPAAPPRDG